MGLLKKYLNILKCPNTWENLHIDWDFLINKSGTFKYKIYDDNFIELLPKKPYTVNIQSSWIHDNSFYHGQLNKLIDFSIDTSDARGQIDDLPEGYQVFIKNELKLIKEEVKNKNKHIAIDISAWVWTYTFELAKKYDLVIHFDLWDKSLVYAYNKAKKLGINNILFVRWDWFKFPFQENIADLIISIDSFIYYDIKDDIKVINDMYSLLNNKWIIFADFHHSKPFFHNKKIHEYTNNEILYLKDNVKWKDKKIIKFCSIPTFLLRWKIFQNIEKWLDKISCFFVRWVIIIQR